MFFCGIDVAKRNHVAVFLDNSGQTVQPAFSFANSRDGFDHLLQQLQGLPQPVTIGLEATGHYWLALFEALTAARFEVIVLNPLQVHAYRKSGIRKRKTDRSDAALIADFVRIGNGQPTSAALPVLLPMRELARFRFHLSALMGDCKRKVLCVLDRVFPEYETLFSSVFVTTSRQLLQEAVTAQQFTDFDLTELTRLLQTTSRGRFGLERAQTIQKVARQSVGVTFLTDAVHREIRCLLQQMELLETQHQQVDAALTQLLAQLPQHITSIPGIGVPTGATLLAEIGDVNRFESLEKLVAYAGIDASVYQSGEFAAKQTHMSKRGSAYLRHALWQAASMAIQYDADLKAYYQRRRSEGKAHGTVLGAVCRKLLARIYVVLKEQRPYVVR
jgi:transposase